MRMSRGIRIIGDVPIYVAGDSVDVWTNPSQFYLDENLEPIDVAGCPPDAFSADGQLWGNPLFRWDVMREDGYSWWTMRLRKMSTLYDVIRIDHFRGFDSIMQFRAKIPRQETACGETVRGWNCFVQWKKSWENWILS